MSGIEVEKISKADGRFRNYDPLVSSVEADHSMERSRRHYV